jgi:hypothetical protein
MLLATLTVVLYLSVEDNFGEHSVRVVRFWCQRLDSCRSISGVSSVMDEFPVNSPPHYDVMMPHHEERWYGRPISDVRLCTFEEMDMETYYSQCEVTVKNCTKSRSTQSADAGLLNRVDSRREKGGRV